MLTVNKLLPSCLAALSVACIVYACKSAKPGATNASDSVYGINKLNTQRVPIVSSENLLPVAKISTSDTVGFAPFNTVLSSKKCFDDGGKDKLTYEWTINNKIISTGPDTTYIFETCGLYHVVLKVTGATGNSSSDTVTIKVEKPTPKVSFQLADNSTFFFDKPTTFRYAVIIQDGEKEIDRNNLQVTMKYMAKVSNDVPLTGYPQTEDYSYGRNLIMASDCKTCHQVLGYASIPSFMEISEKYWDNKNAIGFLANKIITGGSGVWGQQVMSAHPQINKEDATEIVKYILSVSVEKPDMEIPQAGTEILNEHVGEGYNGRYIFTATYTDRVGGSTPLTGKDIVILHSSKVEARRADVIHDMLKETTTLGRINNGSYFVLKNIDLKDVRQLTYRYSSKDNNATIEVHTDAPNGQLISTATAHATGSLDKYEEVTAAITNSGGKHDLFILFVKTNPPNENIAALDWIKFIGGNEVKVIEGKPSVKSKLTRLNVLKKGSSLRKRNNRRKQNLRSRKSLGSVLIKKSDIYIRHKVRY